MNMIDSVHPIIRHSQTSGMTANMYQSCERLATKRVIDSIEQLSDQEPQLKGMLVHCKLMHVYIEVLQSQVKLATMVTTQC